LPARSDTRRGLKPKEPRGFETNDGGATLGVCARVSGMIALQVRKKRARTNAGTQRCPSRIIDNIGGFPAYHEDKPKGLEVGC